MSEEKGILAEIREKQRYSKWRKEEDEKELICNECGGELSMLHQYSGGEEGYCEKCDKWTCDEDWDV